MRTERGIWLRCVAKLTDHIRNDHAEEWLREQLGPKFHLFDLRKKEKRSSFEIESILMNHPLEDGGVIALFTFMDEVLNLTENEWAGVEVAVRRQLE